jgi:hypothetical protein
MNKNYVSSFPARTAIQTPKAQRKRVAKQSKAQFDDELQEGYMYGRDRNEHDPLMQELTDPDADYSPSDSGYESTDDDVVVSSDEAYHSHSRKDILPDGVKRERRPPLRYIEEYQEDFMDLYSADIPTEEMHAAFVDENFTESESDDEEEEEKHMGMYSGGENNVATDIDSSSSENDSSLSADDMSDSMSDSDSENENEDRNYQRW